VTLCVTPGSARTAARPATATTAPAWKIAMLPPAVTVSCGRCGDGAADGTAGEQCDAGSSLLYSIAADGSHLRVYQSVEDYGTTKFLNVPLELPGETIDGAYGLAVHPGTGKLYTLIELDGAAGNRQLVMLEPLTNDASVVTVGDGTSIGSTGDAFVSLAFDENNVLYGVTGDGASAPEALFIVDTNDGHATQVIVLGNGGTGEALAYRGVPGESEMFHASGASGSSPGAGLAFEFTPQGDLQTAPVFTSVTTDPALEEGRVQALTWGGGKDMFLWAQRYKVPCASDGDCNIGDGETCDTLDGFCQSGTTVVIRHRLYNVAPDGSAELLEETNHHSRGLAFGLPLGGTGNNDFLADSCRTNCFDFGCYDFVEDSVEICDEGGLCTEDSDDAAGYACSSQSECGMGSCESSDCQQYEPICEVVFSLVNPQEYSSPYQSLQFIVSYDVGDGSFGSEIDCTELVSATGIYGVTAPMDPDTTETFNVELAPDTSFGGPVSVFNGAVTPTQGDCLNDTQPLPEFTITEQGEEFPYVVVSSVICTQPDPANCRNQCLSTAACGDGILDPGEACDDGNDIETDDCRNCLLPYCGDGVPDPGEACDDGGDSDACTAQCEIKCGNGVVDSPDEICDDGSLNSDTEADACREDCTLPSCGDDVTDSNEECDDGAGNGNDPGACRADCSLPFCGDGIPDPGEQCDDGDSDQADECRNCLLPYCGDDIVDPELGETCDDGEANSYTGPCIPVKCCFAACGDGFVRNDLDSWDEDFEQCDDGNADNTDGCTNACEQATCGDGFLQQLEDHFEQCDDGNDDNYDGCNNACKIVEPVCGNGVVEAGEQCEGNQVSELGCPCDPTSCQFPDCFVFDCIPDICDDSNPCTDDT